MDELLRHLSKDFEGQEKLRQLLLNKTPKYGNDDEYADDIMVRCFDTFFEAVDGRPNTKGGEYHIDMLPTTCHVYFGSVTGATPDGRQAWLPLSEGISPVQGADRKGPTAVFKSAARMDHIKTGGTLLNMKFTPQILQGDEGIDNMAHLIRSYFKLDSHHVQFNVVTADKLREAQADPDRVPGSDCQGCGLQRLLLRSVEGSARRDHHADGARELLTKGDSQFNNHWQYARLLNWLSPSLLLPFPLCYHK